MDDNTVLIWVAVITGLMTWGSWALQKWFDRRKMLAESSNQTSQSKKTDEDRFGLLTKNVSELTVKYVETNTLYTTTLDELNRQSDKLEETDRKLDNTMKQLSIVGNELSFVKEENNKLKVNNDYLSFEVAKLQHENFEIKRENSERKQENARILVMMENEQKESAKLRSGINKLMEQIRSWPAEPVWRLEDLS